MTRVTSFGDLEAILRQIRSRHRQTIELQIVIGQSPVPTLVLLAGRKMIGQASGEARDLESAVNAMLASVRG